MLMTVRRPSLLALPVVSALVLAGALAVGADPAGAAAEKGPPVRQLRVASFNIHHGVGTDNVLDLERTARLIEAEGAEVIAAATIAATARHGIITACRT